MNKYTRTQKKSVQQGIICLVAVVVAYATMMAVNSATKDAARDKDAAAASLLADENQLRELQNIIDLSLVVEKRFAELQLIRKEPSVLVKTDALLQLLRESRTKYRLSGFKPLNLPSEEVSTLPQLIDSDYDVMVRKGLTIEFESISDLHAHSFITHLLHYAPGFMRLDSLDMQRNGDLSAQAITQLSAGQNLGLVQTKMQLTWVGMKEKKGVTKIDAASVGDKNDPQ